MKCGPILWLFLLRCVPYGGGLSAAGEHRVKWNPRIAMKDKARFGDTAADIKHYNRDECTWNVVLYGKENRIVDGDSLCVDLGPRPARAAIRIKGLIARQDLNGKEAKLLQYYADRGRFCVQCGSEKIALRGANIECLDSLDNVEEPLFVGVKSGGEEGCGSTGAGRELMAAGVGGVVGFDEGKRGIFAGRDFDAGDVVFEEAPVLVGSLTPGQGGKKRCVKTLCDKFSALPEDQRAAILALEKPQISRWPKDQNKDEFRRDCEFEMLTYDDASIASYLEDCEVESSRELLDFFHVWSANAIRRSRPQPDKLFLVLSHARHDCAPNVELQHTNAGLRVQAVKDITKGEEIRIGYLEQPTLYKPFEFRKAFLKLWFDNCTCARCGSLLDDARQFRCPRDGCLGVCYGLREQQKISACDVCGDSHDPLEEEWLTGRERFVWEKFRVIAASDADDKDVASDAMSNNSLDCNATNNDILPLNATNKNMNASGAHNRSALTYSTFHNHGGSGSAKDTVAVHAVNAGFNATDEKKRVEEEKRRDLTRTLRTASECLGPRHWLIYELYMMLASAHMRADDTHAALDLSHKAMHDFGLIVPAAEMVVLGDMLNMHDRFAEAVREYLAALRAMSPEDEEVEGVVERAENALLGRKNMLLPESFRQFG